MAVQKANQKPAKAQYTTHQINPWEVAPVFLVNATVEVSQRRRAIQQGKDPEVFVNKNATTGKATPFDYIIVRVNNIYYKFPINLGTNNQAQRAALQEKDADGKFMLLKISAVIEPTNEQMENGAPQTMQSTVKDQDGNEVHKDMPIVNCRLLGKYQLALAITKANVERCLGGYNSEEDNQEFPESDPSLDLPPDYNEEPSEEPSVVAPKPRKQSRK